MPNRWPIANGNWSDPLIWNGGLGLPTASDDVYANLKTVVIDTNVTVFRMTNAASASAILGGGTFLLANGVTLTATSPTGITPSAPVASGSVLLISGSNSATIIGNMRPINTTAWPSGSAGLTLRVWDNAQVTITGSVAGNTNFSNSVGITVSGSGAVVNISGSVEAGLGGGGVTGNNGILVSPSGSVNINGNVSFFNLSQVSTNSAIVFNSSNTLTITGSVYHGDGATATITNTAGNSNIFISGSLIGRTAGTSAIITNTTAGNITVIGDILGPTSATATAISHTSTGNIIISGSIIKRGAGIPISTTGASTTIVTGSISFTGSISGPVISSTSGLVRIASPVASFNTFNPIYSPRIQYFSDSRPTYTFQSDTFNKDITFYDVSYTSSLPSQTDVRSGSLYGGSAEFSGSMVIPSTSSVRYGVPVDTVTGSAVLTPQDILNYATQNLTGSNTIGARLKNIATTQTTAATIAAFKGK